MLASLILPIVIAAVVLFFASFLSWMVVKLHRADWGKIEQEDAFIEHAREIGLGPGSYSFPYCDNMEQMKTEEMTRKLEQGPIGVLTVFPKGGMGGKLALTFVYFAFVNFVLAYLGTMALPRGAAFMDVFRFIATAGVAIYLAAIVQHAIWFHNRITGHVIESIVYAAISGVVFGLMWPGVG